MNSQYRRIDTNETKAIFTNLIFFIEIYNSLDVRIKAIAAIAFFAENVIQSIKYTKLLNLRIEMSLMKWLLH